MYGDNAGRENDATLAFIERRPDHQIGYARLVYDRNEHDALGREAGPDA
jgi:hypothetical protein